MPWRDAALHLALDDHRVDHAADVVDRDEADDAGDAGLGVDLHLADVAAAGEGEVGGVVERRFLEARLQRLDRVVVRHVGGERDLAEASSTCRCRRRRTCRP